MPKKSYRKPSPTKQRYHEYLKSPDWDAFKAAKLKDCPKVCRCCEATQKIQLHHMIYRDNPLSSVLDDTVWLCFSCHKAYHLAKPNAMRRNTPPAEMIEYTLSVIRRKQAMMDHAARVERDKAKRMDEPAWSYCKPVKLEKPAIPQIPVPKAKPKARRALSSFTGVVVVMRKSASL